MLWEFLENFPQFPQNPYILFIKVNRRFETAIRMRMGIWYTAISLQEEILTMYQNIFDGNLEL